MLPLLVIASLSICDAPKPYSSPYSVKFRHSEEKLLKDILAGERGNPKLQSKIPFDEWDSGAIRKKYGAWGPPLKAHEPPEGIAEKSAEWKRERVLALGLRYRGISYQHHHLPDWEPPTDWPWKEVAHGRNAKGIDCSNFTTFVYDVALGIRFTSAVVEQSESTEAICAGKKVKIERIEKPKSFAACLKSRKTGDLLFITSKEGKVSHVVIWVGAVGGDAPLVLDSTGTGHKDSRGEAIPDGVNLRPFSETGWYFKSFAHIHRIIAD
jgi:hypothetical protein